MGLIRSFAKGESMKEIADVRFQINHTDGGCVSRGTSKCIDGERRSEVKKNGFLRRGEGIRGGEGKIGLGKL